MSEIDGKTKYWWSSPTGSRTPWVLLDKPTLTAAISAFFSVAFTLAVLYALRGVYRARRQSLADRPHRSEESRSPPRGRSRGPVKFVKRADSAGAVHDEGKKQGGWWRGAREPSVNQAAELERYVGYFSTARELARPNMSQAERKQMEQDQRLYYQLQNLEDHPECIPVALTRLHTLLDHTLVSALSHPSTYPDRGILALAHPSQLRAYFAANHKSSCEKYKAYLARRSEGGPRELFPTQEYAKEWLRVAGVVKYVDGVWAAGTWNGGIGARSAYGQRDGESAAKGQPCLPMGEHPSAPERRAAKLAWQVVAEEFGDGDLFKNHVYIYHRLLSSFSPSGSSPPGDAPQLLHPGEGSPRCITAAVAQQCIGLFASGPDFFPESLGFNMAYETLPYHLLVTSYELRELGIDDYYFALHVTIDNPDTGHAAMGRMAVERYLEDVNRRDGEEEMMRCWRRVQAGAALADGLPTTPVAPMEFGKDHQGEWKPAHLIPSTQISTPPPAPSPSEIEHRMVSLLTRKSLAAESMHCPSRARICGQTIEQWLNPAHFTPDRALDFLRALAGARPWVTRGEPGRSRLVKELEWGGRMFGAFTRGEVQLVKQWVEWLGGDDKRVGANEKAIEGAYKRFCGIDLCDGAKEGPVGDVGPFELEAINLLPRARFPKTFATRLAALPRHRLAPSPSTLEPHLHAALLLTSLSLLDLFHLCPAKFASPLGSTVLRILRAQAGLPDLHRVQDICQGTDSYPSQGQGGSASADSLADVVCALPRGLWEIAETFFRTRRSFHLPRSLVDLAKMVDRDISPDGRAVAIMCATMLELRSRPYANQATLLGLTSGSLKWWIDVSAGVVLPKEEEAIVMRIVDDVRVALQDHLDSTEGVPDEWREEFDVGMGMFEGVV